MTLAVGLVVHRVVDLRDMLIHNSRRESLWRDLARARCTERTAQILLGRTVHDVVVGETVVGRVIRMPRHLIGELFDIPHVLAVGGAVVLRKTPLAACERKGDMAAVAFNQPRRAAGHGVRGEIDIGSRRILVAAVVDLFRIDLCIGHLVIDVEVVPEDLARDDLAIEVDVAARDRCLCPTRRGIVQLIVARVIARKPDIRILELVGPRMELLHTRFVRILRITNIRECNVIPRAIIVARHDRAVGHRRRTCVDLCEGQTCLRFIQFDILRAAGLEHRAVFHDGCAVIDFVVCRLLLDREIERCLGNGSRARQVRKR